jgi:hypothetical protein
MSVHSEADKTTHTASMAPPAGGGAQQSMSGTYSAVSAWVTRRLRESWTIVSRSMASSEPLMETVTAGALDPMQRTSLISVTGAQSYTLADGRYLGQRKNIRVTVAATSPDGTLTPATFADGTSIDLDAVNEAAELEWTSSGWRIISIVGATINA